MNYRRWSLALGLGAVLVPAWLLFDLREYVRGQSPALPLEGKEVFGPFANAVASSCVLSIVGFVVGFFAYRKLGKPRPAARTFELCLLLLPAFVWIFLARPAFVWVWGP